MRDLIPKEEALKGGKYLQSEDGGMYLAVPIERIRMIQAVEAVEQKHGKWEWSLADNGWAEHKCSVCGYTKNTDIHVRLDWNYCPHCGAKMDGAT